LQVYGTLAERGGRRETIKGTREGRVFIVSRSFLIGGRMTAGGREEKRFVLRLPIQNSLILVEDGPRTLSGRAKFCGKNL